MSSYVVIFDGNAIINRKCIWKPSEWIFSETMLFVCESLTCDCFKLTFWLLTSGDKLYIIWMTFFFLLLHILWAHVNAVNSDITGHVMIRTVHIWLAVLFKLTSVDYVYHLKCNACKNLYLSSLTSRPHIKAFPRFRYRVLDFDSLLIESIYYQLKLNFTTDVYSENFPSKLLVTKC